MTDSKQIANVIDNNWKSNFMKTKDKIKLTKLKEHEEWKENKIKGK